MNTQNISKFIVLIIFLTAFSLNAFAQNSNQLIKRTKFKTETLKFGSGGTISVVGAPNGAIRIEGWNENKVEISAEIEVQAENEEDLAKLAEVCGFVIDESMLSLRIISVGTNDKKHLKEIDKNFPKKLRGMPYKVNYKIKVPVFSDLEIDGGKGDFILSNVEGTMRIKYLESNAKLELIGGTVQATIGLGDVDVTIAARSWRGRFAEIQVARGNLNVWLPNNLDANLTAKVLRTGKIENSYELLEPVERTKFTDNVMLAKAGNGGANLSFTVGDGMLKIDDFEKPAK
ncbi:MAG: hypothetical protein ACR2J3_08850 [Aridibacter sp.]